MLMFALTEVRYLDTVRYTDDRCGKMFRATDLRCFEMDKTGELRSVFNIHLMQRCAVDQELYDFIVTQMLTPASRIANT
jgi:hypothetical protein